VVLRIGSSMIIVSSSEFRVSSSESVGSLARLRERGKGEGQWK